MTQKEKIILYILAALNFTHIMDFMIMMPLGPQLMTLFRISPRQFSIAVSAYAVTAGVSSFITAFFADRFDRKKILLFAYIGFIVGTFSCAFAPNYELLVAARVLAGLFGGMIGAQVLSIVSDTVSYERRAEAMGIIMTAFALASVIGVPAGLWLAAHYNWHAAFLSIGYIGLAVIGLIWWQIPAYTAHLKSAGEKQRPLQVVMNVWQSPNQRKALTLTSVLMMGHFMIIPFIAPYLVGNTGYRQEDIFLIYLVGGGLTIFSSRLVGVLADRKGKYPVFVAFALLSLIPVWLITNMRPAPLGIVLAVSSLFFIIVNGRMIPLQAMVSNVPPPQQRGGFMSINSSVQQMATGISSLVGGAIIVKSADGRLHHYDWVGYLSMALILICVFLAGRLER